MEDWRTESADTELPIHEALEYVWRYCAEARTSITYGEGVTLSTVHSAKGTEYDHVVLVGSWPDKPAQNSSDELRRLFYVGMTRASKTLTVVDVSARDGSLAAQLRGREVLYRRSMLDETASGELNGYTLLGPCDLDLGYAGRFATESHIHHALASLKTGDTIALKQDGDKIVLSNRTGLIVGSLSKSATDHWATRISKIRGAKIFAVIKRTADQDENEDRRSRYRVSHWEVPLIELNFSL